ncbi:hypothetical protein [Dokdonella sp.]|uniref:hypothetical protein n=1 Tax=Dokdonella sp. TaxID=2291710 RepID=UPI002F3F15F8
MTLGTDLSEGACGGATQLDVTRLDPVNFCYVVTNHSPTTLAWHTLADDVSGVLLSAVPIALPPGASYQYNRIVTARESQAPDTRWTAYDVHPGYAFAANLPAGERIFADGFDGAGNGEPVYDFVDITGIGTPLGLEDDDSTAEVDVGFPFTYYGLTADRLRVAYNGGILFDLDAGWFTPQNEPLPAADVGAAILPYWTDIYYQQPGDGDIYVATLGTAPNRRFVVEWFNLPIMIGGIQQDSATFEAVLSEGSNEILFQYADTDVGDPLRNDGITATIGLNAPPGVDAALQYSYKSASVAAGRAILFSPTTPLAYSATSQVVLDVGVPKIEVTPARLDVAAAAGASTEATLDIGNVGNRPLIWNIGSFANGAQRPPASRYTVPLGDPAATTAAPAPRRKSHPPRTPAQAPRAEGVAAFAIDFDTSSLVSLDATHPDAITPVAGVGDLILTAGEFVDEDFSRLYAIDYYTWHLLTLDTRDGTSHVIGTAVLQSGAGINWGGLAWDASTGTLYGVAYAPGRFGYDSFLYTIDPLTAATTLVGRIGGIGDPADGTLVVDIAVDAQGDMFGVDLVADDFVAIDKTSGNAAVVASLGFDANFAQGLDVDDYTGQLYYAAFNNSIGEAQMYTVEPSTGALTLVDAIGADPTQTQLAAFSIARLGGVCAYPNDVPWLAYSITRGSTPPSAVTAVSVSVDASTLTPGTYHANVCIANNDLTNRRVAVPVTFTVN